MVVSLSCRGGSVNPLENLEYSWLCVSSSEAFSRGGQKYGWWWPRLFPFVVCRFWVEFGISGEVSRFRVSNFRFCSFFLDTFDGPESLSPFPCLGGGLSVSFLVVHRLAVIVDGLELFGFLVLFVLFSCSFGTSAMCVRVFWVSWLFLGVISILVCVFDCLCRVLFLCSPFVLCFPGFVVGLLVIESLLCLWENVRRLAMDDCDVVALCCVCVVVSGVRWIPLISLLSFVCGSLVSPISSARV